MVQEAVKNTMVTDVPAQQVNGSQTSTLLVSNETHRPITNVSTFNNGSSNIDVSCSLILNSFPTQSIMRNTSNSSYKVNGRLKESQIVNTNCGILKNPEIEAMLSNLNLSENIRNNDFYDQKSFNAYRSSNKNDAANINFAISDDSIDNKREACDLAESMLGVPRSKCASCANYNNHLFFLSCLHSYCSNCLQIQLQKMQSNEQNYESAQHKTIVCVVCDWKQLLPEGMESLPEDAVNKNVEQFILNQNESPFLKVDCTLCKGDNIRGQAVVYCSSCPPRQASICAACMRAHLSMNRFKDHILQPLPLQQIKHYFFPCSQHPDKKVSILCRTCKRSSCVTCCQQSCMQHDVVDFEKDKPKVASMMAGFKENCTKAWSQMERLKKREEETEQIIKQMENNEKEIKEQIVKDFEMVMLMLNVKKMELLSEASSFYQPKHMFLENISREFSLLAQESVINLQQIERLKMFSSEFQECFFENYFDYKFKINDMKFENRLQVGNFQLNYIKRCQTDPLKVFSQVFGDLIQQDENKHEQIETNIKRYRKFSYVSQQDKKPDSKRSTPETTSSTSSYRAPKSINKNNYDKTWRKRTSHTSRSSEGGQSREVDDIFSKADMFQMDDTSYKSIQCVNTKGGVSRKKIYCKLSFGEEGYLDHQFLEPGGICSNQENEVIVADANNHQVKVFDLEGRLLRVIGGFDRKREAEKRKFLMESGGMSEEQANKVLIEERDPEDTPLVFPNRVCVCPISGNIVVTERTPTNRVQVVSKQNIYLYEFGQKMISHPRGVAVDCHGNILVLESKVNRILVFSSTGKLRKKFYLSQADFPNSIAVNKFQEVYVADNKRHCVHVYDYNGEYLRQVGGLGTTNYPISVCIGPSQEVYVMDNHTNFNVTLFNRSGDLLGAVQSDFKHNQCYDACVTHNNHVIVSTRDNKIHIYSLPVYFLKLVGSCSDDEEDINSIHDKQKDPSSISQQNYEQKQRILQQPNGNFPHSSSNFQYWLNPATTPQQAYNNLELQSLLNNNWNIPFFKPQQSCEEVPSLNNFYNIKPHNSYPSIDNFVSSNNTNTTRDPVDNMLNKVPYPPGPHNIASLQHFNFGQQPANNVFNFLN